MPAGGRCLQKSLFTNKRRSALAPVVVFGQVIDSGAAP